MNRGIALLLALLALCAPAAALAPANDEARVDVDWNAPLGAAYPDLPIEVRVGLQIDQITNVDQSAENFGVVGTVRLEWQDPNLAFSPSRERLQIQAYTADSFITRAEREHLFAPSFAFHNQQGRRFSDDVFVAVYPEGKAIYHERFSATLQAPDFDFRAYPFDSQQFFAAIETQWAADVVRLVADDAFSGLGDALGEEEWIFEPLAVEVTSRPNLIGKPANRISFVYAAHRHIWYYILRIFVPLLIIVLVSWATFALQDFSKRVDVSAGNLLVFIAFNFTISNDLPRLGYLTLMDVIMGASLAITGLTVIWNVVLRRMEIADMGREARMFDAFTLWMYPLAYGMVVYLAFRYFAPDFSIMDTIRDLTETAG